MKTCPQCGDTFESAVRFCPRDGTALRSSASLELVEGAMVAGRYEIVRELGKGGMGVVYLANHVKMERPCALKVLRPDLLVDAETVARFHREARSASRISHPNVVAIHDFGEAEDGTTYLAMEFVEGRSLESLLDEVGTLPPRRAARITWQVANGLNVAHDLKIVHRDLKPANIMLTRYRSWEDFVKIVDFGIAKAFGGTSATSSVTSTGQVIGTPLYMSPEQWTSPEIDHRSDIFSLAMITVRMLAGGLPAMRSLALTSGQQLLDAIPQTQTWPNEVKEALSRALAPDPEERYGSAVEFARALVQAVTPWELPAPGVREPWEERLSAVATAPQPAPEPAAVPAQRKRGWTLLGAAGVIALVAVMAWAAWPAPSEVPISLGPMKDSSRSGSDAPASQRTEPRRPQSLPGRVPTAERVAAPVPPAAPPGRSESPPRALSDSLDALRHTFDLDRPDADSAGRVVRLASDLLTHQLPDSARIEVSYLLAEAQLFLGADAPACAALRGVRSAAEAKRYFVRSIAILIDRHCN